MMKRINLILYLIIFLSAVGNMCAQNITIPFICGFEDAQENSQWVLNARTPNATDQWYIGDATWSEGRSSLYISSTGGATTIHGCDQNIVMAYRTIRFPQGAGKYNISFDWKSVGDTTRARLYVFVGRKEMLQQQFYTDVNHNDYGLLDLMSETNGVLSNNILSRFNKSSDGVLLFDCLYGSRKWQNFAVAGENQNPDVSISLSNSASQYEYVLAFVWINSWNDPDACGAGTIGACIDNIQIASADLRRPYNLSAYPNCEDSSLVLSWQTTLASFDIEYRNVNENVWRRLTNIPATNTTIQTRSIKMTQEGNYNIRIRGCNVAKTDTSAYASINNIVYWCPENHCINYVLLEGDGVECRTGSYDDNWEDCKVEVVDNGEEAIESRHTINWIEERTDPNTAGSINYRGQPVQPLLTIPEGHMASVRLGNWETGHEQESITYTFEVDSFSQAILIMKYAIVFQEPEDNGRPYFNITVLDENGRELNPTCGKVSFYFEDATEWNHTTSTLGTRDDIYWKDWTSMGLDLRQYHGRTVRVRATTKDCKGGAHFGYAYFVMDCVSAHLYTNNCGDQSLITIDAPEGFTYTWTDSQGNVVGTDKSLTASAGYEVYTCEACMKEAENCCFELSTDFAPRYPYPELSYKFTPRDCRNLVEFTNLSHVLVKYDDYDKHTDEECDQIEWTFIVDGETSYGAEEKPIVEMRPEGGVLRVKLRATLGGGVCFEEIDTTIVVPSILSDDVHIYKDTCQKDLPVIFDKQERWQTGEYIEYKKNIAGCDSLTILHLTVYQESEDTHLWDTICSLDLPYVLNGLSYIETDTHYQNLDNVYGCDSMVILHLQVVDKLEVEVEELPTLCADGEQLVIDWSVFTGEFDSLAIRFTGLYLPSVFYDQTIYDNSISQAIYPYGIDALPGYYHVQLEFYQHSTCGNQVFDLDFDLLYRSSIVEQKWNDVLAILSPTYNGGYNFTAFQWYKDDMPIDGETGPYLYQPLETGSEYYVVLWREDGVAIGSCPIRPTIHEDVYQFPTLVEQSQKIPVRKLASSPTQLAQMFDVAGRLYSTTVIDDNNEYITAPALVGHYIVRLILENEESLAMHLIVL